MSKGIVRDGMLNVNHLFYVMGKGCVTPRIYTHLYVDNETVLG